MITGGPLYVNVTLSHISRFGDFVDGIYPIELEVKDTTYTDRSVKTFEMITSTKTLGTLGSVASLLAATL
jgi:hypothetical protein